jgi:selenide,water dikinase
MLLENELGIELNVGQIPYFDKAIPLARAGKFIPGGTLANIRYIEPILEQGSYETWNLNLLSDPQTSGGLLIAMPRMNIAGFQAELKDYPFEICEIGEVISGSKKIILR